MTTIAATALDNTIVVNTCAVTAEAERQARQAIRRAAREHPEARIVVTGCAVQINPAAWAKLPGVDRVLGNQEKLQAESWAADAPDAGVALSWRLDALSAGLLGPTQPPPAWRRLTLNRRRAARYSTARTWVISRARSGASRSARPSILARGKPGC